MAGANQDEPRYSLRHAAELLDVTYTTFTMAVKIAGIPTYYLERRGRYKFLTESGFKAAEELVNRLGLKKKSKRKRVG